MVQPAPGRCIWMPIKTLRSSTNSARLHRRSGCWLEYNRNLDKKHVGAPPRVRASSTSCGPSGAYSHLRAEELAGCEARDLVSRPGASGLGADLRLPREKRRAGEWVEGELKRTTPGAPCAVVARANGARSGRRPAEHCSQSTRPTSAQTVAGRDVMSVSAEMRRRLRMVMSTVMSFLLAFSCGPHSSI
jgi:hypothetical protein